MMEKLFQSTLPARGATGPERRELTISKNFNPHSPRGERPAFGQFAYCTGLFQSTLPARGATCFACAGAVTWIISIHTPREGSD